MRAILVIILLNTYIVLPAYTQKMLLPSERIIFSFLTNNNKKVIIASDTGDKYLVYRYGTNSKAEFQYPTVLDTLSWRKFSYAGIIRGQGFDGTGALDLSFLTFCNEHYRYVIYETSYENKDYAVGVKVQDTQTKKKIVIPGNYKTKVSDISVFRGDDRVTESGNMYED